ncbi:MAG TPA: tRNA lysidine(34) synthetase TilS [Bryobacteraceae bacterium]|nr:tRNA lysidine(34) synthetase TilS [Bryobacteraceae bacterium]
MLARGQSVGVAVSGGADSVCLLHLLLELAHVWDLRLAVLHVNHRLRGGESAADAEFVARLAERFGLPFHLRESAQDGHDNLEQAARRIRLTFFREMTEGGTVDRVAVGHTRSDQAETVLFRFLRGSGSAGLAAIRPTSSEGIIRPLLDIDRTETRQFLESRGIVWREDSSNASLQFARNRIRLELLPQLASQWNPQIRGILAHMADWAQAEEAYWATQIDRLAQELFLEREGAISIRVDRLKELPTATARRLVRRAIERVKQDTRGVDFQHIESILAMAGTLQGNGRVQIPGLDIRRSFDWIRWESAASALAAKGDYSIRLPVPGEVPVPGTSAVIHLDLIEKAETSGTPDCVYNDEAGCIDWGSLRGSLELRNWRPGDQYRPVGSTGKQKIKTLFHQARIPIWERSRWPVMTDGASVVWAWRFGVSADFVPHRGTSRILKVWEASA